MSTAAMRYYAITRDGEIFKVMLASQVAAESNAEYMAGQHGSSLWSYRAVAKPPQRNNDTYNRTVHF